MNFGSFVFSISTDPEKDHEVVDRTLHEVELAEQAGFDAVWLTEHHFDGAVAYADPVVFGTAVAMRTQRMRIGFAVLEMALYHPVRLAVQTALLDHLSKGRLIVGTGRGSAYNEYEYIGFGITLDQGRDMLAEAEELLIKAWTGKNVDHHGRYWHSRFPELRPRPYQKPHPPLLRACISETSVAEMAKVGRPVLIGVQTVETLRHRHDLYRETMHDAKYSDSQVEHALDETWVQRGLIVAESDQEAQDIAGPALDRYRKHLLDARINYNISEVPAVDPSQPRPPGEVVEQAFLAGTPSRVAELVDELKDIGARNVMLNANVGQIEPQHVERTLGLFGEQVTPKFKDN